MGRAMTCLGVGTIGTGNRVGMEVKGDGVKYNSQVLTWETG